MEYGACVSSCHRSCRSLSAPDVCSQECAEGCVCPDGTFYSSVSRRCVTRVCKEGLMILENPRPGKSLVRIDGNCEVCFISIFDVRFQFSVFFHSPMNGV
ncbi:VWF factor, partial [Polypterus senegalus]